MALSADGVFRKNIGELLDSGLHADIEVKVGATTFKAHKAILCAQSEFFRSAFDTNSGFKEAKTNTINLGEPTTPEAARAMLQFLYRGGYDRRDDADAQFLIDTDVFVAGEIYMIHGLKELAFSYLCDNANQAMRYSSLASAITNIYNFTPEDDRSLRDLLVDTAKRNIENNDLLKDQSFNDAMESNSSFAKDLVHALSSSTIIWEVDVKCKMCNHVNTVPAKAWDQKKAICCDGCDTVYGPKYWVEVE